jgi:SAM-dependent methyltransferase
VTGDRNEFFRRLRTEIEASYFAEPGNPYRQSGRSRGARRWEETRRCIADAVARDGSFLDVGCANGLLLESLQAWLGEKGIAIEPFGVDFLPSLVDLARARLPAGTFWVANAWSWSPPRRFDCVRTNLEYVLPEDRAEFVAKQADWVAPGGRLVVCHYHDPDGTLIDTGAFLADHGHVVVGTGGADGVSLAWTDPLPG